MALTQRHITDDRRILGGVLSALTPGATENPELVPFAITITPPANNIIVPIAPADSTGRVTRILNFQVAVNGAAWTGGTSLILEGTNGTDLATLPTSVLGLNARTFPSTANVVLANEFYTGLAAGVGLQLLVNGNYTAGGTLTITGLAVRW